jgi:Flp pilus assembly protein TadG
VAAPPMGTRCLRRKQCFLAVDRMPEHPGRRTRYGPIVDHRGTAALEFALVASIVVTLLLAAFDIGIAMLQYAKLNAAVRAGGQYAITFPTDTSGIEAAVNAVLPGSMQASVTIGCECSNGGGGSPCGSVSGSCSSCPSSTTQRYVHVASSLNASTWFTTPLAITPLSAPSACYVARVQ